MDIVIKSLHDVFIEIENDILEELENDESLADYEVEYIYKVLKETRKVMKAKGKN